MSESLLPVRTPDPAPLVREWSPTTRLVVGLVLILYSVVMFAWVRFPYLKIEPGSATDVLRVIKIEGAPTYEPEGELLYLTIGLSRRLTPFEIVLAWLDDQVEIVEEQRQTGDLSREEFNRRALAMMRNSELVATKVALDQVGYDVEVLGGGALVTDVLPDRPAAEHIRVGDVVVAVDGERIELANDAIRLVRDRRPGETVSLTVERDGEEHTYEIETVEGDDGVAQVGLGLHDDVDFDFPIDVEIDTGQVGGPSAGLAFALALIDELTEGELTGGQAVAVTGEIAADGRVIPVGGVIQKAVAARRAGAVLMLVPDGEEGPARTVAGDMTVVPVTDIEEALAALAEIGGNGLALPEPPLPSS